MIRFIKTAVTEELLYGNNLTGNNLIPVAPMELAHEFTCVMFPVEPHTLHSETLTGTIDNNGLVTFNTP